MLGKLVQPLPPILSLTAPYIDGRYAASVIVSMLSSIDHDLCSTGSPRLHNNIQLDREITQTFNLWKHEDKGV